MSDTNGNESVINGDLIDLNASTPIFHDNPSITSNTEPASDNLIDTELPLLEQKLQVASQCPQNHNKGYAVDVEDILITLDDDHSEDNNDKHIHQSISNKLSEKIETCDNIEALAILSTLDEVLNASLAVVHTRGDISEDESDDRRGSVEECCVDEQTQRYIEDCLLDLDDYLKRYDSSNCEDCQGEDLSCATKSSGCDRSECMSDASSVEDLSEHALDGDEELGASTTNCCVVAHGTWADSTNGDDDDDDTLREKLRQIEENYSKFLASGCANRGCVIDGDDAEDREVHSRRPSSACGTVKHAVSRNQPGRSTIAVVRKQAERPLYLQSPVPISPQVRNEEQRRGSDPISRSDTASADRTSAAPGPFPDASVQACANGDCSDEDIDWSWVQDVAGADTLEIPTQSAGEHVDWSWQPGPSRDVSQERLAHAAGDRCTGSVVVEPQQKAASCPDSSRVVMSEAGKAEDAGSWLRDSMRRLRRFPLPSDADPQRPALQAEEAATPPPPLLAQTAGPGRERMEVARPVSAPSRLPAREDVGDVRNVGRSRSRSRSGDSFHSAVSHVPGGRARSSSASSRSRRRRSLSSSGSSIVSSVDTSASCTPTPTPVHGPEPAQNSEGRRPCERNRQTDMPEAESPLGHWPHGFSSMLACLGCTLGLFNISRFALLTIHFGANFIFQFILLSLVFGMPLFTLQLCLGQQLGAGVVDMWRISPLFQGVGVALLISQMFIGLYSIIGVSWMFVYFRDSFITKVDRYRWAEPFLYYRNAPQLSLNGTYRLSETVPDYFSGIVLQRHHLPSGTAYSTIKFQSAFNLAVIWMIVFVSLSKGLRSYGKVVYVFTLLPVFGTFVICAKILGMMPQEFMNVIFPETTWDEFFINSRSWLAASQEAFLTWGLLGAAVMQIASHNKHKHLLQRDSSLVAVITIVVLILVAFLANTCVQILKFYGYSYIPDSFEHMGSYIFLRPLKDPLPPNLANTPVRYMVHNSFIVGEKVVVPGTDYTTESGYQAIRLATELVPATFAVMGSELMSPFWAVLFYFVLILFGISQQLAIWHCVITGIMAIKANVLKSWETTITFFSCACGFILGLPMTTELGIYVLYFMDYVFGGIWWLTLVILLQILAVFMVRGRPYSGDTVVTALFTPSSHPCLLSWAPALLSFTWNVIVPVALMMVCITTFKNGNFREMFVWHHAPSAEYWPLWARQTGSIMQLVPVLCVPFVAVVQSYRYLANGPDDILERIQLLYRPPLGEHMEEIQLPQSGLNNSSTTGASGTTNQPSEDPPPKYTPPPSYTTATGARIAKFLRQSIRRSVRRIATALGEATTSRQCNNVAAPSTAETDHPPPNYNDVLVEMNRSSATNNDVSISIPDCLSLASRRIRISTLERLRSLQSSSSALTAAEVASILRSSFRRSTLRPHTAVQSTTFTDNSITSLSAENLIEAAAPIGETSLILENPDVLEDRAKTESDDFTSSVI